VAWVCLTCAHVLNRRKFRNHFRTDLEFQTGVYHALYDTLSKKFPDQYARGHFKLSARLSAINQIMRRSLVYLNVANMHCKAVFLGHIVYHTRLCLEYSIHFKRPVFAHGGYNFAQINRWDDPPPPILRPSTLKYLRGEMSYELVQKYISLRSEGGGYNPDILELPNASDRYPGSDFFDTGYILCYVPVLGDSPFGWIDRDRAFCDVLDWLISTRDFCIAARIPLLLKLHPSSRVWGEDTQHLLRSAGIVNSEFCKVIRSDLPPSMQRDLITRARQIISFKGTIALETVSLGWSTIVISRNVASHNIPGAVLKPQTVKSYLDLLKQEKFSVSQSDRQRANEIIYAQDNLLSFASLIGAKPLFSGLSREERDRRAEQIITGSFRCREYFNQLGCLLAAGYSQPAIGGSWKGS
jgi:hypothetical protein